MINGLRPCAEMKPSGLPWLGHVPAHWDVRKLRHCGSILGGLTPSMADRSLWDGDVPWVTPKDMKRFTISSALMNVAERAFEATSLRLIPAPAVLMVVRGMILARRVPVARTDQPVTINQDMKAIVPLSGVDAGYLAYRLDAAQEAFVPMIDEAGHGTKRFPTERWKELPLAVPPLDEQRLIVRFLDWHGAQTAKLVRAKKKIIALLNEQKQAIIHRAVTRGLDPNAKLKPSGNPWLGDVPEGWSIQSLGSMIKRRSARNRTDLPLLSVVRERGVILRSSMSDEENHNFVPDDLSNYKVAMRGDLVINKMKAWQGSLGIAPCDGIVSPAYFVYEFNIEDIAFGQMLLRSKSYVACFARVSDGVRIGQWDLSIDGMKRIPVLRPTHDGQIAIVEYVDRSTLELERAKEFTLREITLIQEFRTRLIADVVTGKLDVRAAAAGLPEATEIEPIDDLIESDDLDEAIDETENEEVAA